MTTDPSDAFSVYTVSWEVHNGAKWEPASITPAKDKAEAEAWAEKMRNHPIARTRKVEVTEQRVREVTTAVLPYWVPAGDAA